LNKPKLLFATPVLHHPPNGGPTLRIENSIKALSQISDLYLYIRIGEKVIGGKEATRFYKKISKGVIYSPHIKPDSPTQIFFKRVVNYISNKVLKRKFFDIIYPGGGEDYEDILFVAKKLKPVAIWLGYGNISYPLLKYLKENSTCPIVLDTDSVWSRFVLRGLPFAKNESEIDKIKREGKAKEIEESWGTRLANITTAVSEIDAEYYRALAGNPNQVMLFSNVIDLDSYKNIPQKSNLVSSPNIYLAGTFWPGSPMEEAARWVIKTILPTLRNSLESIQFNILGKGSDRVLKDIDQDNINVLGEVDSVLPYLCHADIILVPLKFESGTRFKILEAGACSKAVVSTTLGAEGIPVVNGQHIMIADSSDDFSKAILQLLKKQKLRDQLGKNLHKLIGENYSLANLENEGKFILNSIAEQNS
jgi:glycosyltransferase involved in cell wall biosynthesis